MKPARTRAAPYPAGEWACAGAGHVQVCVLSGRYPPFLQSRNLIHHREGGTEHNDGVYPPLTQEAEQTVHVFDTTKMIQVPHTTILHREFVIVNQGLSTTMGCMSAGSLLMRNAGSPS